MKKILTLFALFINFLLSNNVDKVGAIYSLYGECEISNEIDDTRILSASLGASINNFDIISSSNNSKCAVIFDDKKTKVDLIGQSKIRINNTNFSREITLEYGDIIVENSKSKLKTYITTFINDIYINNSKIYISSDYVHRKDKFFSIDSSIEVYNKNLEAKINFPSYQLIEVNYNGEVIKSIDEMPYFLNKLAAKNDLQERQQTLFLNPSDLIPVYNKQSINKHSSIKFDIEYSAGTRNMNAANYIEVGIYPYLQFKELLIGANFQLFVDNEGNIFDNWDEGIDILENIQLSYKRHNNNNFMIINAGQVNPVTFGHGYLVRDFSNSFNFPYQKSFGLNLFYRLDKDFLEFNAFIPSFRDYINGGGVFGLHSSLFLSHRFPLKLGLGIIIDLNQASSSSEVYSFSNQSINDIERTISAVELDYTYTLMKRMNLDVSLYGEFSGIWYPKDIYYLQEDGNPHSDDLRWRDGSWGILGPGISVQIQNRYKVSVAFASNSAGHLTSYFNNNYMFNRSVYYNANNIDLEFPLIFEQIAMINEFLIDEDEYLVPKEIYPILSNTFNAFPIYGFVAEFEYNYKNRVNFSSMGSVYFQQRENTEAGHYYSIEGKISIKDNVLRNISFLDLYLSNIFFWNAEDKDKMIFGFDIGFNLLKDLTLILDINQIYYDSNMNGSIDPAINMGINLGMQF